MDPSHVLTSKTDIAVHDANSVIVKYKYMAHLSVSMQKLLSHERETQQTHHAKRHRRLSEVMTAHLGLVENFTGL